MYLPYLFCALITTISSCVSLSYSYVAVRNAEPNTREIASYSLARSIALFMVALVPFLSNSIEWLEAIALAMILVQAFDAVIGAIARDWLKTFGPASMAVINAGILIWLL